MLNFTNHERNANQNRNRYHLTSPSRRLLSKRTQIINFGKSVEKREPSYTVDETELV